MKYLKILIFFIATALFSISLGYAKAEYTKKEGKACNYCHTKGKELNDIGKCYQKAKALDGCTAPETK